jgi:hypothetical protein
VGPLAAAGVLLAAGLGVELVSFHKAMSESSS